MHARKNVARSIGGFGHHGRLKKAKPRTLDEPNNQDLLRLRADDGIRTRDPNLGNVAKAVQRV